MAHSVAGHDMPVQMKDVLKRGAGVGGEAEALDACVSRHTRSDNEEPAGEISVGELGDRADVAARYDEHMELCRGGLRIERDDIGVFVADRRWGGMGGDAAEDAAALSFAQRNFTRPSRSGGLSASPSSTRITNFFSQCGVG